MASELLSFELPNVGGGPNPLELSDLADDAAFVVLLLMQSPGSGACRRHARRVAAEYETLRRLNATVAVVVPGPKPKVRAWRRLVDPPFPILADREARVGERFDQPSRYGPLGQFVSSIGRVPMTVVLDVRRGDPAVVYAYEGETSVDRPSVREIRSAIEKERG